MAMKSTRLEKLTLSRETLTQLATADLTAIAGGFQTQNYTAQPGCIYYAWSYDSCP
jgi:hypothetical protein